MAAPQWPTADKRKLIGSRQTRLDGPVKSTGRAKYADDINRPGMLFAKLVGSTHTSAGITNVDTSAADAMDRVVMTWVRQEVLEDGVEYDGQIIAAVCAETEEIARAAAKAIKITYEPREHQVTDLDKSLVEGRARGKDSGDVEAAFAAAKTVVSGTYGLPTITHCCLEPHGQASEMQGDDIMIWASTQNVSGYADRMDDAIGIPRANIKVDCQYMGGGFGSKFPHDIWGIICSTMTKETGKPVKLLLDRDMELKVAGNRPSAYADVKVGLDADGMISAVESFVWGTAGLGGYRGAADIPYVFEKVPNTKNAMQGIKTNRGNQRAWRAPGHPQAALITMGALEDAAAAAGIDALEFFMKNVELTDRPDVYREELQIAADMIGYKEKAHARGEGPANGSIKRGIGMSIHTWGGQGHPSACDVSIHPDGSVDLKQGTQDLGTGTRTVVSMVVADTFGIPIDGVKANIGNNSYPASGPSGGSTTVGGVSAASRLAATDALNKLLEKVAPELGTTADKLEAWDGKIQVMGDASKSMSWKDACALLGTNPITGHGENDPRASREMGLIDAGVGGAQMADVSVDIETGVVTINEVVAVQDCGLIIDMKTAESQVMGALIMGITSALFEECVYDAKTGKMLNADMEFYRLAGLKDIGDLKVHMMTGPGHDERGVIGLGEPPMISPAAAISNAVANAIGVRVPHLPLTPDRVLNALYGGQA